MSQSYDSRETLRSHVNTLNDDVIGQVMNSGHFESSSYELDRRSPKNSELKYDRESSIDIFNTKEGREESTWGILNSELNSNQSSLNSNDFAMSFKKTQSAELYVDENEIETQKKSNIEKKNDNETDQKVYMGERKFDESLCAPLDELMHEKEELFEMQFDSRPLGFSVNAGPGDTDAFVRCVIARGLELAAGDKIVCVNGINVEDLPHMKIIDMLCNASLPLTILFSGDPDAEINEDDSLSVNAVILDEATLEDDYSEESEEYSSQDAWSCEANFDEVELSENWLVHGAKTGNEELLRQALENQDVDMNSVLNLPNAKGTTVLIEACKTEELSERLVEDLIEAGSNVLALDFRGSTALHYACKFGFYGKAKMLIEQGAVVSACNNSNITPLHMACTNGALNCVKLLIENKANIDLKTKFRYTPLLHAAESGHTEIVKYLLENKAKPNAKNNLGQTALMRAARHGHNDVVELLMKDSRTDVLERDANGKFAFHYADPQMLTMMLDLADANVLEKTTVMLRKSFPAVNLYTKIGDFMIENTEENC